MNQSIQSNKYDALIKKIKRKRKIVTILTIIAVLTIMAFCSPTYIGFFDKAIIDSKGIHPILTAVLVVFIFLCAIVAYAIVSSPLETALNVECDPEKYLILNTTLNKQSNLDSVCATAFFYMGNYRASLDYSNKMIATGKSAMVNIGLFNKARCEFFIGDLDSFRLTVGRYEAAVANTKKASQKTMTAYYRFLNTLNLLLAIADNDKEKIGLNFNKIEVWNASKATEGYINYLKGVAAYYLGNREESTYRFMAVKETCFKTIFAKLADKYLEQLK